MREYLSAPVVPLKPIAGRHSGAAVGVSGGGGLGDGVSGVVLGHKAIKANYEQLSDKLQCDIAGVHGRAGACV